jgi:hypothetical protein
LLSTLAVMSIATAALLLMALPAAIGLGFLGLRVEWVGAALTFLGALLGGVKLMAMAWAVGGRIFTAHPARAIAAVD